MKDSQKGGNIRFIKGNLFDSSMQTLTNTINTAGAMGAGIAKEFKKRYPAMYIEYRLRCERQEIKTGEPYLWTPKQKKGEGKWILNFPTKQHWRNKSQIQWIEEGLQYLLEHYKKWEIESIAISALGCGMGGLKWCDVKPIMSKYLKQMDIEVEVYEPIPYKKPAVQKKCAEKDHTEKKQRTLIEGSLKPKKKKKH